MSTAQVPGYLATPQQIQEFYVLLNTLLSPQNEERNKGEQALKELRLHNPDILVHCLLAALRDSATVPNAARQMVISVLRATLTKMSSVQGDGFGLWVKLSENTRELARRELLWALENETFGLVRKGINTTIADVASLMFELNSENSAQSPLWSDLLPFLFKATKSPNDLLRESSFTIFADLAGLLGPNQFRGYFAVICDILKEGLLDPKTYSVRLSALLATSSFLQIIEEEDSKVLGMFRPLMPHMLDCINVALQHQKEDDAQEALEMFIDLADSSSMFFKPNIQVLVKNMFEIISTPTFEDETKRLALEVMVTLCEARPGMMKKVADFIPSIIKLILLWTVEGEDNDEDSLRNWNNFVDEEEITNSIIALDSLDRICLSIHGKTIVPILFSHLNQMVTGTDWRQKYAAMQIITTCCEGCKIALKQYINDLIIVAGNLLSDPHPKVRYSAMNCIAQLCTDFCPDVQEKFGEKIVQLMIQGMRDQIPRVQHISAAAVINFFEAEFYLCKQYAEPLLRGLEPLFRSPMYQVQESAIGSVTILADSMEKDFSPYYSTFVPQLKEIIRRADGKDHRVLRGRAMNCMCTIGISVGKEIFANDALEVMKEMMSMGTLEIDDPQIDYLESSFVMVAECLGKDFAPFIGTVLPASLQRAEMKPDVQQFDPESSDEVQNGWDIIGVDDEVVAIHTDQLETKANSISIISSYATFLEEAFYPYIERAGKIAITDMTCIYHEEVRKNCYDLIPILLSSAKAAFKKQIISLEAVNAVWNVFLESFVKNIPQESSNDVLSNAFDSFSTCLGILESACLTKPQLGACFKMFNDVLTELVEEFTEILKNKTSGRTDEDYDEECDEDEIEDEEAAIDCVITNIAEIVDVIFKYHKDLALEDFHTQLFPQVSKLITTPKDVKEALSGLMIMESVIENSHTAAVTYKDIYMKPMLEGCVSSDDYQVRQMSAYGIGIAATSLGDDFLPYTQQALMNLNKVITAPNAFQDLNKFVTENAISSIGKIMESQRSGLDHFQIFANWVQLMPLRTDKIEACTCHKILLKFVGNQQFFGHFLGNSSYYGTVAKVVEILGDIVETDLVSKDDAPAIATICKTILPCLPNEVTSLVSQKSANRLQAFLQKC